MIQLKLFLPIALLILGVACKSSQKERENENIPVGKLKLMQRIDTTYMTIDLAKAISCDYGEVIDSVRYVQLGDEQGVMGVPKRVIGYNNKFYIQEEKFDRVFILDESGKCINKIANKGRGPKEYLSISNIDINKVTDELVIVDGLSNRLFLYDLDGNFKKVQKIAGQTDMSLWLKDSTYIHLMAAFQNGHTSELKGYGLLVTKGSELFSKGYRYLPVQKGYCGNDDIFSVDNGVCYRPLFSDSVYRIFSDTTYGLEFHVKMGNSVWEKYQKSSKFVDLSSGDRGNKLFPWIFETKTHILGYCDYEKKDGYMTVYIHDKNNNRTYLTYKPRYQAMKTLDQFWGYDMFGTYEEWFITVTGYSEFDSANILERVNNGSLTINNPELEKIIKNITVDSNPVLVLTKYKINYGI